MARNTHQNLEAGGCWQLPASHSFQITYKHKDFSFCGTPNLVHVLLHKCPTQEPLPEYTHFHSKLRDSWTDPRSHSRRLKAISGFLAPPGVTSVFKAHLNETRQAQSGPGVSSSGAGSGTVDGRRGGRCFLLCSLPLSTFPPSCTPTRHHLSGTLQESLVFLAQS